MRGVLVFLRATIVGGVLFLAPLVVLWVVLNKAVVLATRMIKPLADRIPDSLALGAGRSQIIASLVLVIICFLAGLLARSAIASRSVQVLETKFLSFLPGYEYLKTEGASVLGAAEAAAQPVVIVRIGDSWRIGVKTETIGENWLAIFIPNSPNPHRGSVFIVERSKVRESAIPLAGALAALRRCGAGAGWAAETLEGFGGSPHPPLKV
jgi:uncharacterized membrane protein